MQLLWEEYGAQHPGRSYSYPRLCALNRNWKARQKRSMRQTHQAGHKCFLITVVAPLRCTIRKPTRCVKRRCFRRTWRIQLHLCRGKLEADAVRLAGKPYPDGQFLWRMQRDHGLRQSQSGRYDPQLNPSSQQWAEHYGVVVLPARPRRPQDKAKVEVPVQIVQR